MKKAFFVLLAGLLVFSAVLFGCAQQEAPTTGKGLLVLRITDDNASADANAPSIEADQNVANIKQLLITISSIEVHKAGSDANNSSWVEFFSGEKQFDLTKLVGITELLGSKQLEAGHYTQIRLEIKNASIKIGSSPDPLFVKVPSEKILLVNEFSIDTNKTTELILDFNLSSVKKKAGEYIMKPAIKVVEPEQFLEVGKQWIELKPIQCMLNAWEQYFLKDHNFSDANYEKEKEFEALKKYYKDEFGITLSKYRVEDTNNAKCADCNCWNGQTIFLLVNAADVNKAVEAEPNIKVYADKDSYYQGDTIKATLENNSWQRILLADVCNPYILQRKEGEQWVDAVVSCNILPFESPTVQIDPEEKKEYSDWKIEDNVFWNATFRLKATFSYYCPKEAFGKDSVEECLKEKTIYSSEFSSSTYSGSKLYQVKDALKDVESLVGLEIRVKGRLYSNPYGCLKQVDSNCLQPNHAYFLQDLYNLKKSIMFGTDADLNMQAYKNYQLLEIKGTWIDSNTFKTSSITLLSFEGVELIIDKDSFKKEEKITITSRRRIMTFVGAHPWTIFRLENGTWTPILFEKPVYSDCEQKETKCGEIMVPKTLPKYCNEYASGTELSLTWDQTECSEQTISCTSIYDKTQADWLCRQCDWVGAGTYKIVQTYLDACETRADFEANEGKKTMEVEFEIQ